MRQTQHFFSLSFSSFYSSSSSSSAFTDTLRENSLWFKRNIFRWMFITWLTMLRAKYREFIYFDKYIYFFFFFFYNVSKTISSARNSFNWVKAFISFDLSLSQNMSSNTSTTDKHFWACELSTVFLFSFTLFVRNSLKIRTHTHTNIHMLQQFKDKQNLIKTHNYTIYNKHVRYIVVDFFGCAQMENEKKRTELCNLENWKKKKKTE